MTERSVVVDVLFSIDGIVGRETYEVDVVDPPEPLCRAWFELEDELISAGLATFACSCCLAPESGVKLLELRERAA